MKTKLTFRDLFNRTEQSLSWDKRLVVEQDGSLLILREVIRVDVEKYTKYPGDDFFFAIPFDSLISVSCEEEDPTVV